MLVKILIGVGVIFVAFLAIAATRPSAYHVERTLEIAAPPDAVFAALNDLHRFAGVFVLFGDPLEKRDPQLKKTFGGPPSGVGQTFAWEGEEAGKGQLTIAESVPNQKVGYQLVFTEPMASKATVALALAPSAAGTAVTWSMDGNHNFFGKAAGLFMNLDEALGGDLDKGLAELKSVLR